MRRTSAIDAMHSASVQDCVEQSHQLADLVLRSYQPDCVVGLLNGGILPAIVVAQDLGLEGRLFGLRVKRKRDVDGIYRFMPKSAAKLVEGLYYLCSRPVVEPVETAVPGRHILIVDDRADTEASLKAAVACVQETAKPATVKTAVLSWLGRWPPVLPPDYYVHTGMLKFPWSANAASENPDYLAEYQEFMLHHTAYLARRGIELAQPGGPAGAAMGAPRT